MAEYLKKLPENIGVNGPISVAIVVFGEGTSQGEQLMEDLVKFRDLYKIFDPIDIRNTFPIDPCTAKRFPCEHDAGYDSFEAQTAVHQYEGFYNSVRSVCDVVVRHVVQEKAVGGGLSAVMPVFCDTGLVRSGCIAAAAAFRVLSVMDFGHGRVFNANVFHMTGSAKVHDTLRHATTWLHEPWVAELVADRKYAKDVLPSSLRAGHLWTSIGELVNFYERASCLLIDFDSGMAKMDEFSDDEVVAADDTASVASRKRKGLSPVPRVPKPPPFPPPAPLLDAAGGSAGHDVAKKEEQDDKWGADRGSGGLKEEKAWGSKSWGHKQDDAWSSARGSGGWHDEKSWGGKSWGNKHDDGADRTVPCPFCSGSGSMQQHDVLPKWATFEKTPEGMCAILESCGVDQRAQHEAWMLAQRFESGPEELNDIIHNLLRNWSHVGNPSAFVAKACMRIRNDRIPKYDATK